MRIEMEIYERLPVFVVKQGQTESIKTTVERLMNGKKVEIVKASAFQGADEGAITLARDAVLGADALIIEVHEKSFIRNETNKSGQSLSQDAARAVSDILNNGKNGKGVAIYIDELQINLRVDMKGINPVGDGLDALDAGRVDRAIKSGKILKDLGIMKNGDSTAWKTWDPDGTGPVAAIDEYAVRNGQRAHDPRFAKSAETAFLNRVATDNKIREDVRNAILTHAEELEPLHGTALEQRMMELVPQRRFGESGAKLAGQAELLLDYKDTMNTYARALAMEKEFAYQYAVDSILAEQTGVSRESAIPANNGAKSQGQVYDGKLMPVMEYVAATAYGKEPNYQGLHATPENAYRSGVSDWMAELSDNSARRAVTGNMADARGVVENVLGLSSSLSTETGDKI